MIPLTRSSPHLYLTSLDLTSLVPVLLLAMVIYGFCAAVFADTAQTIAPPTTGVTGNSSEQNTPVAPNVNLKEVATNTPATVQPSPATSIKIDSLPTAPSNVQTTTSPEEATTSPEAATRLIPEPDDVADATPQTSQSPVTSPVASREKLVLLGAEVSPGTSTRLAWSAGDAITGLALPTPVLVVNGTASGDTLCLTGAIHGDELNGIEIVRRVIYDLDPEKLSGTVIGVPIVNLQGFQRGSRYLSDRRDLNRHFPGDPSGSLASRIAYSLFDQVIRHCDLLVDLHTGSLRRTNMVQVRADMRFADVIEFTQNFDDMVVVHSPGSEGMLRQAAVAQRITAVTLEVGESMRLQEGQVKQGVLGINSLLDRLDMYKRRFTWGEPEPVYYKSEWIRATRGGILFSNTRLGKVIAPGDILGTVTDPITNERTDITSSTHGRVIGMAVNQVVMPGFAAYHIGIEASEDDIFTSPDFLATENQPIKKNRNRDLVPED